MRAFGLDLDIGFDAPGLDSRFLARLPSRQTRQTRLRLVAPSAFDAWPPPGTQTVAGAIEDGPSYEIRRHHRRDYVLRHDAFGRFRVRADGGAVDCALGDHPGWYWQRFMCGQLLPLAALLQGLEPFHASGVARDGRAYLFMGASGAGKSSVAAQLAARGLLFMADDVAALELVNGEVIAYPGAALATLASSELRELATVTGGAWQHLGCVDGEVRVTVPAGSMESRALPVGGIYLLQREGGGDRVRVERQEPSVATLVGATFNAYHTEPERLSRQLRLCARLSGKVPLHRVRVPPSASAARTAEALVAHGGSGP